MNVAVVASEASVVPYLEALREVPAVSVVAGWSDDDAVRDEFQRRFAEADWLKQWDEALVIPELDAALIVGTNEDVIAAAKQLAQRGVTLWVVTHVADGPGRLFELTSVWQDHPELVRPLFVTGVVPVAEKTFDHFEQAQMGPLWRLEFRRCLIGASPGRLTQLEIDRFFFQDAEWVSRLTGRSSHVTLQTSGPAAMPVEATIILGGEVLAEVRWILTAAKGENSWQLLLRGERGMVAASAIEGDAWQIISDGRTLEEGRHAWTEDAVRQLTSLVAAEGRPDSAWTETPPVEANQQTWDEIIRLAEIGASARRSLARRRTIEIHHEDGSERNQFKSQMTAVGCGVLLWTLLTAIAALVMAAVADPRDREYRTSSSAGFVLEHQHFVPGKKDLTETGLDRLSRLAAAWSSVSPVLLIEATQDAPLDERRLKNVTNFLQGMNIRHPEERVHVRHFSGKWFRFAMWAVWVAVFGPLAGFLAIQGLIVVARPGGGAAR